MSIGVYEKHMIVSDLEHLRLAAQCPLTKSILLQSSYIAASLFITCNGLTKTSLLSFYLRISPQLWYQRAIWLTIVVVATYTVIIASMLLFGCHPIHLNWDPYATGTCLSAPVLYMAIAVSNIVSDVVLFTIPIPMILRLKMRPMLKIGAIVMFGIGSLY